MTFKKQHDNIIGLTDVMIIDNGRLYQAIKAAALGNTIEWFDVSIYGFIAYALGEVFFPSSELGIQRMAVLATFSVPFLVRPLGGLFFGALGDKYGRQKILSLTIIIMSLSTACISIIPSYHSIGIWSPICLILCKIVQGFAVGGEYIGAAIFVAEYSPDRKRGFMSSWLDFSSIAGFLLGAGLVVLISFMTGPDHFRQWGWRILFLMALPLGLMGLHLRRKIEETPVFQKHVTHSKKKGSCELSTGIRATRWQVSLREILASYWRSGLTCIGLVITTNVTYYMLLTYLPSYLSHNLHYSEEQGIRIMITIMLGMLLLQPIMGLMSDKFGRRPLFIIGSSMLLCCAMPCFMLINSGMIELIYCGLLILSFILNSFTGVMASVLPVLFPTRMRYSALAVWFNISVLIASFTPTISAWLVEITHNLYVPAYYLMIVGGVGLLTGIMMRETANLPLRGTDPIASNLEEAQELVKTHHINTEKKITKVKQQLTALEEKRSPVIH
ncbi:glycine betaine/L-proline transporter ProP [Candidatus Erwinia haradaeae]|uniref:Proline/betaine transporter n=1 Tax=Candidatus Erwinia haradaeae TaxID=1922217 RepID=A0A451DAH2_9GAMM|nr:glycine betaine/L-proline transporter ProP [Candidatus Erwinia haradaeae]VFP83343.1 Proline/betaine transporter [Candidatus Erwinia haradaeae]